MEGQRCTVRSVRCETVCTVRIGIPSSSPLSSPAGRPPHLRLLVVRSRLPFPTLRFPCLLLNRNSTEDMDILIWSWPHLLSIFTSVLHPIRNHTLYQAVITFYVPANTRPLKKILHQPFLGRISLSMETRLSSYSIPYSRPNHPPLPYTGRPESRKWSCVALPWLPRRKRCQLSQARQAGAT
ncbi:hypothetical protein CTA2_10532 [Colletotrichum tanaceti]|nr:hypothetical protein CTA2_10532 [Colletotrichum tanaceti]